MRRVISILLAAFMLLLTGAPVYAENVPEISVSSAAGKLNDTVKVDVSISNNVGIASYTLKLNYDNTMLRPISIKGNNITSNIQQSDKDLSKLDYVTAVWVSDSNYTENGILFSLEFRVISAKAASSPLELSYKKGDICNQNLEDINPSLVSGVVTLNSEISPSESPSESSKPSESPSESSKPSEEPSESSKPSESPSESAKPSESPSESANPSESPSESINPSETHIPVHTDYPYTINSIDTITADGRISVDVGCTKGAEQTEALLIIAIYDYNGVLVDCKIQNINGGKKYFENLKLEEKQYFRAYIWDNTNTLKPLCKFENNLVS